MPGRTGHEGGRGQPMTKREEAGSAGGSPAGSGRLGTEGVLPGLADLELRPTLELVRLINDADAEVPAAVAAAAPAIAALAEAVVGAMSRGGRLIYVGAGSAGRIAALDAYECGPTFGCAPGEVIALVAGRGDDQSEGCPSGAAEDDREAALADLARVSAGRGDAVVGVSASGSTPYVLAALEQARRAGAVTGGICNNPGSPLAAAVEHPVEVLTGAELIAGSTRMKATSAQKLVLHTLSTVVMIRRGRTYGPLMVAMRVENEKLRRRAVAIVAEATGVPAGRCAQTLAECEGEMRRAIVCLLAGCDPGTARRLLEESGGDVRSALGRAARRAQPFTAPDARPETTLRWTRRKSSTTGRV